LSNKLALKNGVLAWKIKQKVLNDSQLTLILQFLNSKTKITLN